MPIHSTETPVIWNVGDRVKMIAKNNDVNLSYNNNIVKVIKIIIPGRYVVEVVEGAMTGRTTEWTPSGSKWGFQFMSEWDT